MRTYMGMEWNVFDGNAGHPLFVSLFCCLVERGGGNREIE